MTALWTRPRCRAARRLAAAAPRAHELADACAAHGLGRLQAVPVGPRSSLRRGGIVRHFVQERSDASPPIVNTTCVQRPRQHHSRRERGQAAQPLFLHPRIDHRTRA
jgi:hypothetical protein